MTYSDAHKFAAGLCYRAAHGNVSEAEEAFCNLLEGAKYDLPHNCYEFVQYWGPRLNDSGEIECHASLSGRHRALTDLEVKVCWMEAIGWWQQGRSGPYQSVAELIETNPTVQAIMEHAGVTGQTLTTRIKEIDPGFKYGKTRAKAFLDEQHKEVRVAACQQNLARFKEAKPYIIFVDEKVLCFNDDNYMGWFSTNAEDYHYRMPQQTYKRRVSKFKYIIAVNYLGGPLWIKFFTGTAGLTVHHAYKVSSPWLST